VDPSPAGVKTMRLRYAGTCVGCGATVGQGERAHFLKTAKTVRCLACGMGEPIEPIEPLSTAGASANLEAMRAMEQAERLATRQAAAERRAAAFAAGAEGERIVAEALAPLSAAGYLLLHDRASGPRANLDHLVIGTSGVWLVNAKHWSGTITAETALRHNGRDRTKQLARAAQERAQITEILVAEGLRVPVRSVFAFTAVTPEHTVIDEVTLVPVAGVRSVIGAAPPVLDGRTTDRVVAALVNALPSASEREHAPAVAESELPEELREDGAYIFLEPWSGYGKKRLYVHRFGNSFGYVDLQQRTCHVDSDHERAEANLEFVLAWFADVDAEPRQIGRLGRLAMWVAGGAPRRAVTVRFRRRNTDRLYVHLADGKSRTQIGYYDLLAGKTHAAETEFAAIVGRAAAVRADCASIR
jgi:hypothetical protein